MCHYTSPHPNFSSISVMPKFTTFLQGLGCTQECSGHGKCKKGSCLCDELSGWRGSLCEVPGCPGIKEDCSGHGSCNSADKKCICDPG
jgi:hypothetical protein